MKGNFGWCFVGAGSIAHRVMADMYKTDGGYLAAVCANTFEHAKTFAEKYGARAYMTADEAFSDPEVRAVYVAVPHTAHKEVTLSAIRHGLPVLCEKPFAITEVDAAEMISAARGAGLYIAEGMWTRHNVVMKQVLERIRRGDIGDVASVRADFSFASAFNESSRLWNPALAGGALFDIGVYTVALADFIFGCEPSRIDASARFAKNGVDASTSVFLSYPGGAAAELFSSIEVSAGDNARIIGTKGTVELPKFWSPTHAVITTPSGRETIEDNRSGEGFNYEFDAAMNDIRAGRLENEYVTHEYTLRVMRTLDKIRAITGLRYPFEAACE